MATDVDFIEYVLEQAAFGGRLAYKRMFGEYALYLDDKVVAFACDNSLFLKPTDAGRAVLPTVVPGKPYPEAKDYYVIDEFIDDTALLRQLIVATADALPAPKPKAPRPAKAVRPAKPSGKQAASKQAGAKKAAAKGAPAPKTRRPKRVQP
ncbi:TfoX domain-containing protein [Luteimonas marina]|uniref:TfoX domain-containing protein n=1 Tax=Luteimonas marina TaxID=488485 RepID=A0A5C5U2V7_9GAMM|nr:TfoX/Sxy family protein [Luteimonas marina]TWT19952.1 TfoX domain-containing protein [Luteimonas marina]